MDLETISAQAANLYMQGGDGNDKLIQAFTYMEEHEIAGFPEIALQAAKAFVVKRLHDNARRALDTALLVWRDDPENQARVYITYAFISLVNHDTDGVRQFVEKVRANSTNEMLLVECENLLGESKLLVEPGQALNHFDKALLYFINARAERPMLDFDVARVSIRAAHAALQQGKRVIAEWYLRHAEGAAERLKNPEMTNTVLTQIGEAYESQGDYHQATRYYDKAAEAAANHTRRVMDSRYNRARIEILRQHDDAALLLLGDDLSLHYGSNLFKYLLLRGWIYAFNSQPDQAISSLQEVETLARDDRATCYEAVIARGFVDAKEGIVSDTTLPSVSDAANFFDSNNMPIKSGQAHLILGWLHALNGDELEARESLACVEASIAMLGHVNHLCRLFGESVRVLGSMWNGNTVAQMEQTIAINRSDEGIHVYAFGIPKIFVNGRELRQREEAGKLNAKLLIYMLEKRQAELWEITTALWADAEPEKARKRFHRVANNLKDSLGISDWISFSASRGVYVVRDDFPQYYDAGEFNKYFEALMRTDDVMQSLMKILRIVDIYSTFARTFDGEVFEELRHHYVARYERALYRAEEIMPRLINQVPRAWYESVLDQLSALS